MALRAWRFASVAGSARNFSSTARAGSSGPGDYLHESVLPMHHFQRSLPRLPIPKLEDSCGHYINAQRAVLSHEDATAHEALTEVFQKGVGADLHQELIAQDKRNKHTSYITDYWFDMYLSDRVPLPLHYNPFIAFTDDENAAGTDQLKRAATLVSSAMRFMRTYQDAKLSPELFHLNAKKTDNDHIKKRLSYFPEAVSWYGAYLHKVFPLDMSQYGRLFNSTRVPREHKDELVSYPGRRHIAVLSKGNFYTFDVLNEDGSAVSMATIYSALKEIQQSSQSENKDSIASLTSDNRNKWAAARAKLIENPSNAENLEMIDSSVFMLCLEEADPDSVRDLSYSFLYGESHNRWFDKSLQLIVCNGGKAAVNFEHAWGDGVAVLRFLNEVYDDVKKHPFKMPMTYPKAAVRSLSFTVDGSLKSSIASAKQRFNAHTSKLCMDVLQYSGMNRKFLKEKKLSADAILQFSLQLAFYRQYGFTPATYESCSTAAFKHGRTETVRPATVDTAAAVSAFLEKDKHSKADLRELINKASETHSQLIKNAAMGKGFDRHLFALKKIAEANGKNVDMFTSQEYKDLNHIILSTSTLSSPAVLLGGFAPVVSNGLGVGYRIDEDSIGSQVTAYKDGGKSTSDFVQALALSLKDIQDVFE